MNLSAFTVPEATGEWALIQAAYKALPAPITIMGNVINASARTITVPSLGIDVWQPVVSNLIVPSSMISAAIAAQYNAPIIARLQASGITINPDGSYLAAIFSVPENTVIQPNADGSLRLSVLPPQGTTGDMFKTIAEEILIAAALVVTLGTAAAAVAGSGAAVAGAGAVDAAAVLPAAPSIGAVADAGYSAVDLAAADTGGGLIAGADASVNVASVADIAAASSVDTSFATAGYSASDLADADTAAGEIPNASQAVNVATPSDIAAANAADTSFPASASSSLPSAPSIGQASSAGSALTHLLGSASGQSATGSDATAVTPAGLGGNTSSYLGWGILIGGLALILTGSHSRK